MQLNSVYRPSRWLPGPHAQTIWASRFRSTPSPDTKREQVELDDDDFLNLYWLTQGNGPIVIIVHGLEGDSSSNNVKAMFDVVRKNGWNGVLLLNRNCGGFSNRLQRTYHAGETGDLDFVVNLVKKRFPDVPLMLYGYSLGGNTMLKWLGEKGDHAGISAAAAVSIPFDLASSTAILDKGFSKIYQKHFVDLMREAAKRKFRDLAPLFNPGDLNKIKTLREFDEKVTAPLHGFVNADQYYSESSCKQFLKNICVPTLIMNSLDDPFLERNTFPGPKEVSDMVELEFLQNGGHAAFITGSIWKYFSWIETRIPEFFKKQMEI
ncbi:MAG TPA: alpha/beta fold hydrolase [Candidatus Lambdaproteobacteria bacterium]|nr:alpha/beta fold hydrolase [SAR324 cluster bacterium]HBL56637.1 hydrolase [Deltaproteobacteria bacterium]HIB93351.1 alpha/beta fold hydrolase [Candidatus Lambdaproteobacteria bacterium]